MGIALASAAVALFGWITYEPANVMATLRLEGVASEATVVLITLALAGLAMAGGCAFIYATWNFGNFRQGLTNCSSQQIVRWP